MTEIGHHVPPSALPMLAHAGLITESDVLENIGSIAMMLMAPDKIKTDRNGTLKAFTQLTIHSVGNREFHKIYERTLTGLLDKGGMIGAQIVEILQQRTSDVWATRNDMINIVKKAQIFGKDEVALGENYKIVSDILGRVCTTCSEKQRQRYETSLTENHMSGQTVPQ